MPSCPGKATASVTAPACSTIKSASEPEKGQTGTGPEAELSLLSEQLNRRLTLLNLSFLVNGNNPFNAPTASMTQNEILRRFPNASRSTLVRNQAGGDGAVAQPEQAVHHEPVGSASAQEKDSGQCPSRFRLQVVSFRTRLLDLDNLCAKFHVDALRYLGIIPDDSPAHIDLLVSQEKVSHTNQCRTEITITPI